MATQQLDNQPGRSEFSIVPNWIARGGHGAINVAVLLSVVSHAGTDGRCTASAQTIAEEVGCSRRLVFRAVGYWERLGQIAVRRAGSHGGRASSIALAFSFAPSSSAQSVTADMHSSARNDTTLPTDSPTAVHESAQLDMHSSAQSVTASSAQKCTQRRTPEEDNPLTPLRGKPGRDRPKLYHGRDPCYVGSDGAVVIGWRRLSWSGHDAESFRFGELRGKDALDAARRHFGERV